MVILGGWVFHMSEVPLYHFGGYIYNPGSGRIQEIGTSANAHLTSGLGR